MRSWEVRRRRRSDNEAGKEVIIRETTGETHSEEGNDRRCFSRNRILRCYRCSGSGVRTDNSSKKRSSSQIWISCNHLWTACLERTLSWRACYPASHQSLFSRLHPGRCRQEAHSKKGARSGAICRALVWCAVFRMETCRDSTPFLIEASRAMMLQEDRLKRKSLPDGPGRLSCINAGAASRNHFFTTAPSKTLLISTIHSRKSFSALKNFTASLLTAFHGKSASRRKAFPSSIKPAISLGELIATYRLAVSSSDNS
jgi:hypothetical protein